MPTPELVLLVAVWWFALGACIGSFLNVVVYRLPRAMSLSRPRSHCPRCQTPIRPYDNVPIFGWLWLRGRCRTCRGAIAARYPLVEAFCASLFLFVGALECLGRGLNLPDWPVDGGTLRLHLTTYQGGGLAALHLLGLCTLLAAALIEHDGQRPPARLVVLALAAALVGPWIWPHLHPSARVALSPNGTVAGLEALLGLAPLALAAAWRPARTYGHVLAVPAALLGWKAGSAIIVAAMAVAAAGRGLGAGSGADAGEPPAGALARACFFLTLGWILFWRQIVAAAPWLG